VWDDDVRRFTNFVTQYCKIFKLPNVEQFEKLERDIEAFIDNKKPGQVDIPEVLKIKGLIRATEAR
jgi:glucosamine-6-phosphate deaminase